MAHSPALAPNAVVEADQAFRPEPHRIDTEANRRTITVLFADLSGFTTMSERLDPEVMQALQNELFEELTAAVQSYGGFVDKFIGDALLALFGAPAAHEDDPERAVRAALDMIRRTAQLGERSKVCAGLPLILHIGINTGHVVAGGLGAGATKSYSVTGDTVNTAQRLQSIAPSGEVLVGPLTFRLTRHAFSYESLGDVALRGKVGSVLVHRLKGPLDASAGSTRTSLVNLICNLPAPLPQQRATICHPALLSRVKFDVPRVLQMPPIHSGGDIVSMGGTLQVLDARDRHFDLARWGYHFAVSTKGGRIADPSG